MDETDNNSLFRKFIIINLSPRLKKKGEKRIIIKKKNLVTRSKQRGYAELVRVNKFLIDWVIIC